MRPIVLALLLCIAGCGQIADLATKKTPRREVEAGKTSPPGDQASPPDGVKPLTEDERAAWNRLRRQYKNDPCQKAALLRGKGWHIHGVHAFKHYGYHKWTLGRLGSSLADVSEWGQRKAAESNIDGVAIIDVGTHPDPVAVRWFRDDGSGVKQSDAAPSAALAQSLKEYLLELQRRAPLDPP